MQNTMTNKRDDEEYCRQAFSEFISSMSPCYIQSWREIEQSDEPPDYELNLDGKDYAIEVTTLMEKVRVGDLRLPPAGIVRYLWRIVKNVEQQALDQGKLSGAYYVGFLHPIPDLHSVQDDLESFLLEYFEKTYEEERAEEAKLIIDYLHICTIAKVFNSKSYITIGGPIFMKWEGEFNLPICSILQETITDKNQKLRMIRKPIILLLLDMYSFAESSAIKECVPKIDGLDGFHSVFIAKPNGGHFMLKSANPDWMIDSSG